MCGFVGIVDLAGERSIDRGLLEKMNDSIEHRGPDESGVHLTPGVGLGHRRLSIIDLSSGQQPLYNADGSVVVVYNGEIYNHKALRQELQQRGYTFRTHCDTEVIVYAWEAWGEDCVTHFNGMFAFALWDANKSELFLARDRLGIKPLYYSVLPDQQVVFGSELKAILPHPLVDRSIDKFAVEDYFAFGYIPEPRTIFSSCEKLRPGHTIKFTRGRSTSVSQREYWDVPFTPIDSLSFEEAQEVLIDKLRASVDRRLMSEVPLGAFLSGGVDSSAIVALMSGLSSAPVNTCSISFGDPKFNESQFAQQVADQYRTNHRVDQVESDSFDLIDTLARTYDEPFADSSSLPTYRVCQLARTHVTVALSGDGGDENFAGYRRYRWHAYEERVRSLLPQAIRGPVFGTLGSIYPKIDWAPKVLRAKTTLQALARDSLAGFLDSVSVVSDMNRRLLFDSAFSDSLQGYNAIEVFRHHASRKNIGDSLSIVQYLDMKTYLAGDILTKVDRASMAHSLEVRVPLLDHTFVEWVSGISPKWKLKGREGKHIFKRSLEPLLSKDILYREKMGFAIPLASWFRGPLRERIEDMAHSRGLAETGILDMQSVNTMIRQHQAGLRDHSATIWALLMFDASMQQLKSAEVSN